MNRSLRAFSFLTLIVFLCTGSLSALAQTETDSIVTNVVFDGVNYENRTDFAWEWHKPIPESGIEWDGTPDYMSIKYPVDEDIAEASDGTLYIKNQLTFHAKVTDKIGEEFPSIKQLMADYGLRIIGYLALTGTYQVETIEDVTYDELMQLSEELSSEPCIKNGIVLISKLECYEWNSFLPEKWIDAEKNGVLKGTNNQLLWLGDTLDSASPSGYNWNMEYIHAPEAWIYDPIMDNIRVVVLDSGAYEHVDYQLSEPFDLNYPHYWHAVHVGGVIAATHNDFGVSGVFHNPTLISVRAAGDQKLVGSFSDELRKMYSSFTYYLAFATVFSIQNNNDSKRPTVINFSQGYEAGETDLAKVPDEKYLGFYQEKGSSVWKESYQKTLSKNPAHDIGEIDYITELLTEILNKGYDFVICPSAGNANRLFDAGLNSPFCRITDSALIDRIIVTGSFGIDKYNGKPSMSYFSQDGDRVDIAAPGEWIYSTLYNNFYAHSNGTSMAAPHVSGTAAMVWSIDPEGLSGADVKRIILESATEKLPPPDGNQYREIGNNYPVLDTYAALKQALSEAKNKSTITGTIYEQFSNPGGDLGILISSSNALVTLYDNGVQKARTFSDRTGQFSFNDLTPGIYTLEVIKSGWNPSAASEKIYLKAGANETKDITLTEQANKKIHLGDYLTMGTYLGEPIVWRCVDIDENGPLMLSDRILCLKPFDASGKSDAYHMDDWVTNVREQYGSNCWSDSNLRQWLNSSDETVVYSHCAPTTSAVLNGYNAYDGEAGFLHAFTQEELSSIKTVTQRIYINEYDSKRNGYCDGGTSELIYSPTKSNVDYSKYYYQNVTDRIFLLTPSQADAVYRNFDEYLRQAYPTQAAVKNSNYKDASLSSEKPYPYWLGIPSNLGASYEHIIVIRQSGMDYPRAYEGIYGVRPAFYLDGYTVEP